MKLQGKYNDCGSSRFLYIARGGMKLQQKISIFFLIYFSFIFSLVASSHAETLIVGGTGCGLGVMQVLGEQFHRLNPSHEVKVIPSLGSSGGILAVRAMSIDLAISSRKVTSKESQGILVYDLGRTPFVFAVHQNTSIENITLETVADIYSGKVSVWPNGEIIRKILRPTNDSDWQLMKAISPEFTKALNIAEKTKGIFTAATDTDTADYLEKIRGSFGASSLAMIVAEKRNIKILSLNGVSPSVGNIDNGTYPLTKPLYLIIRQDASSPSREFVHFILSAQGQQLLRQAGMSTSLPH